LKESGLTNNDIFEITDINKYEKYEHQLCFHYKSTDYFNEKLQYGNKDKAEFLKAMNVLGSWIKTNPMFDIEQRKFCNNNWQTLSSVIRLNPRSETNDFIINKYQRVIGLYNLYKTIQNSLPAKNKTHSYIIHMSSVKEREHLVNKIVEKFSSIVYEAIVINGDGAAGCRESHTDIYKKIPIGDDLLLFEDDCEIRDDSFMNIIKKNKKKYDIIYIGVTHKSIDTLNITDIGGPKNGSWGTHAMWISSKAIQLFLNYKDNQNPVDHIWNEIERIYNLNVWRPYINDKYVKQKNGIISCITNNISKC
jgi:hypothetical protein